MHFIRFADVYIVILSTEVRPAFDIPGNALGRVPCKWRLVNEDSASGARALCESSAEILIFAAVATAEEHVEAADIEQKVTLRSKEAGVRASKRVPAIRRKFAGLSPPRPAGRSVPRPTISKNRYTGSDPKRTDPGQSARGRRRSNYRRQLVVIERNDVRTIGSPDADVPAQRDIDRTNCICGAGKA